MTARPLLNQYRECQGLGAPSILMVVETETYALLDELLTVTVSAGTGRGSWRCQSRARRGASDAHVWSAHQTRSRRLQSGLSAARTGSRLSETAVVNVVLLGPPGAGKGTQAPIVAEAVGGKLVSTGELLRQEVRRGTPRGVLAGEYMNRGELVPDDVVLDLVMNELASKRQGPRLCSMGFRAM